MRYAVQIGLLLISILCSCTQSKKYPYPISVFNPTLKKHLVKLIAVDHLPYNADTLTRNFLRDSCTKKELVKLLSCENPLVRVVAYRALVNRHEPDYFSILTNHLDDTAKVSWWYYDDAEGEFAVSDLMLRKAAEDRRTLSRNQRDILVRLVLLKYSYLESASWMIPELVPREEYYPVIRKKAETATARCGEQLGASYALAKFKKRHDLALLKANLLRSDEACADWTFKTIEVFPDTSLYPILTNYFNDQIRKKKQFGYNDLKYYCRAVASYKNENSLKILTSLTTKDTYPDSWYLPQNKESVFLAICKYRCPLYNQLYTKLKPQMGEYILKHLNNPTYLDPSELKTWQE
ncbi:hypothetical protein FNT36_16735 [Hymenobacter setariae]|uniref:HEAT repeat domain-containing protein n=1 Tax=Hymenobacter setariae TaxID=2594794 RepID=A0A558BS28_9BACT|nr:hypothetical protein [Hymenobacter setariae]TVT39301.1 hypothetical protein FNT36_16735 [Hymenobacter setariae]